MPNTPLNKEQLEEQVSRMLIENTNYAGRAIDAADLPSLKSDIIQLVLTDRDAAVREAQNEKPTIHVFDTWLSIDMGAEIRFEPVGMWGQRVWQDGGTYVCSGIEVNEDKTSITDHLNYRFTKIGTASYGTGGYKDIFISGKDIKKWIEDGASGDLENYQGWFTLQSQPNAKEGE